MPTAASKELKNTPSIIWSFFTLMALVLQFCPFTLVYVYYHTGSRCEKKNIQAHSQLLFFETAPEHNASCWSRMWIINESEYVSVIHDNRLIKKVNFKHRFVISCHLIVQQLYLHSKANVISHQCARWKSEFMVTKFSTFTKIWSFDLS